MTPARAAQVCATCGMPRHTIATMLTMLPGIFSACQRLAAACIMYQVPLRLVSMTASQPLTLKSIAACGYWPPALLTRASRRPKRA